MAESKRNRASGPNGTITRANGKDGPQLIRTTGKRWSDQAQTRFLDNLAASCNVQRSAAEAGFSAAAIYKRRRDDPVFAQRWQAALEQGCARIEMALVRAAGDALEGFVPDPETPIPTMTVKDALAILAQHRAVARGDGRRRGWRGPARTLDELSEAILVKFEAIEATRERP
jgi:hypothetical protein